MFVVVSVFIGDSGLGLFISFICWPFLPVSAARPVARLATILEDSIFGDLIIFVVIKELELVTNINEIYQLGGGVPETTEFVIETQKNNLGSPHLYVVKHRLIYKHIVNLLQTSRLNKHQSHSLDAHYSLRQFQSDLTLAPEVHLLIQTHDYYVHHFQRDLVYNL